ncbi:hypothetical protein Bca4012_044149 [Brassica carinata]
MGFDLGSGSDPVIQSTFCLKMIYGYFPVIKHNVKMKTSQRSIMNFFCADNYFGCRKVLLSSMENKKYVYMCHDQMRGKPHQEFVKSLCSYKDIFELRNRVEAFALQYEMHASSYQRDCILAEPSNILASFESLSDWTLDSASGYYYNQTNGLHYKLDSRFNYSDSIVKENVALGNQVKRELYALFVEETLDLRSIHSLMENEQEGNGLTRSLGDSSRRDIFLVAQDQEICFGDVS